MMLKLLALRVKVLATLGLIAAASILEALGAPERRLPIGSSCQPHNWCDYGKWLWCPESGVCACLHPKRQYFDTFRNRCVAHIGTECNVYIGDRDCPKDAYCSWTDGTGTCLCNNGFSAMRNGSCAESGTVNPEDNEILNRIEFRFGGTKKPSLPIYQYHQQRLGDVNYRYKIRSTTSSPEDAKTIELRDMSSGTTKDADVPVNNGDIQRYSNEESWRRFFSGLSALAATFNSGNSEITT